MRTVGVDLATEPGSTAVAVIDWSPNTAKVTALATPADDNAVLHHAKDAYKVGIDCPLGWPDTFVDFVHDHRASKPLGKYEGKANDWRRSLANRLTDIRVHEALGLNPLSVSTDRIGLTAMRAAELQSAWPHPVDRAGSGQVVEVYPAAGLLHWTLQHRNYKGTKNVTALADLVGDLVRRAPWLDLGEFEAKCRQSDHAFDAVIAALLARAAAIKKTLLPAEAEREIAAREGWIALPTCALDELVTTPSEGK